MSEQKGRRKHFIFTHFIGFTRTGVVVMYKSGFKNKLGLLDVLPMLLQWDQSYMHCERIARLHLGPHSSYARRAVSFSIAYMS